MKQDSLHRTEDLLLPVRKPSPCSICGNEAFYVDISFESPICSADCAKQMWKIYVDTQVSRKYRIADALKKTGC
ncbi:hypothetical protein [Staphylospora marina]|uniref:hypothetical protein n=1 Tax=Staphylospora marina TaxID=2490858 RepID=UPI000F5C0FD0|nr:hypothetical protein [Staphylospora marina]